MWMVVLLSSSTSWLDLNSACYILYGELFFGFDSFCFVVFYYRTSKQDNNS